MRTDVKGIDMRPERLQVTLQFCMQNDNLVEGVNAEGNTALICNHYDVST
jgi:hypothetical protein